MKNKYAKFPLTMALFAVLCFLFIVALMATAVQPVWGRTMVLLIPAIVLGGIGFLALEGILDSKKATVMTICLSVILLVASLCYTSFLFIWTATTDTSEVQYYHRAYTQIENGNGVKGVFPETIPADAKDISFHYNPAFLQGGEMFNLSFTVTEENISEWTLMLEDVAEWNGSNAEWHRLNNWSFYDTDSIRYHLYWDGGVNHGEMCYVLIAPSLCRISFHYEDW